MTMYAEFGARKIERALGAMRPGLTCMLLLWCVATGANAASVYKCTGAHGQLAYQDMPCAGHARQHNIDLEPQPLIGAPGEATAREAAREHRHMHARSHARHTSIATGRRKTKRPMSWECRAADGEVFYRHTRCPGSVPGDGTVRNDYVKNTKSSRTRSRQGAWGRVPVHGKKISRTEACRRIHSAGAAGRDGHARDETVSTYDHLMGRDPCDNG